MNIQNFAICYMCLCFRKTSEESNLMSSGGLVLGHNTWLRKPLHIRPHHRGHRVITARGVKPCRLLLNMNLLLIFYGSRHCTCAYTVSDGLRNISVDLSLFVFTFYTNFMNKLKFNDCLKNYRQKIIHWPCFVSLYF